MIEARHLTKRYGHTVAVDDASFVVRPGQVTGFLGPNGAGKSTTMRMILGLYAPGSGSVLVNGQPYRELTDRLRSVGALPDAAAIGHTAAAHAITLLELATRSATLEEAFFDLTRDGKPTTAPAIWPTQARESDMSAIIATTEKLAGNAARARLRLLAAFLPVTAALYLGAEALDPKGTDQVVTNTAVALRLLPIAAAHSSQLYLSGSLSVLALGGLAVSYAAIATLVTGRGWVIATIAALLGGLGAFAGAVYNVLGGIGLAAAASAHTTQAAAAQVLVTSFGSRPAQVAEYVYFISQYTAPVVMGYALWRSRAVPRWLAVLFTVGLELAEQMGAIGPKVVLFMLPFAVAMILLSAWIWRAAARPASRDPQPTPVPVSSI